MSGSAACHRRERRSYLDFLGGVLTNMLGYDIAEVREAVERQLATGIVHSSTLYLIRRQVELARRSPGSPGIPDAGVFFTNSGTEATRPPAVHHQPRRSNRSWRPQQLSRPLVRGDGDHRSPQLVASALSPVSVSWLSPATACAGG
ncbi:hypothetical protein GCM10020358_55750 [Amorphoplanes nipponensis]|uniref:hypothetical protein n=1 Tax=Actinoplanes nipponensis TaxID=135950 RepID=UPI0031EC3A85